jgi:hypothetical protein
MKHGLGLNDEWCERQIAQAVHGWRAGHNKRYAKLEDYLNDYFPAVAEDAARRIRRIEKEATK